MRMKNARLFTMTVTSAGVSGLYEMASQRYPGTMTVRTVIAELIIWSVLRTGAAPSIRRSWKYMAHDSPM